MRTRFIRFVTVILTLTLICAASSALPASDGRVVTVGYREMPGVTEGAEENADRSGYAYEYLQMLAGYTGWRYRYVYGDMDELAPMLADGGIDLLPCAPEEAGKLGACAGVHTLSGSYPYCLAAAAGREDLLAQLTSAQKQIDEEAPGRPEDLRRKYMKYIPLSVDLPEEGAAWLAAHGTIRIGTYDKDAPFVYEKPDGTAGGMAADYVSLMLERLGTDARTEWSFYSGAEEALAALREGEIDAIHPCYLSFADAEKNGVILSNAVYASTMSLLNLGEYTADTMSLVATPSTWLGAQYMRENYPDAEIVPCLDGYDCVDTLLAGGANCVVMNTAALRSIARSYNKEFNIRTLNTKCACCFAALPENAGLVCVLNRAASFLTDMDLNRIESSYLVEENASMNTEKFFRQHPAYLPVMLTVVFAIASLLAILIIRRRTELAYRRRLETARMQAEFANEAKTRFLIDMNHDIRTPLNAIVGFTNMARKNINDPVRLEENLNKTQQACNLLLSLTNGILDISRTESGNIRMQEAAGDVLLSFSNIDATMQSMAAAKNVSLTFEFGQVTDRWVYTDYDLCARIFINLITNAVKFTEPGGSVTVSCEQVSGVKDGVAVYRYVISDTGVGMSDEARRFVSGADATYDGEGDAGLGLTVCKSFVAMMNGTMECENREGGGTVITVMLPFRVQTAEPEYTDPATGMPMSAGEDAPGGTVVDFTGKRVLVVEDNELNREIALDILAEKGLLTETAENGEEAVELLRGKGPDYYDYILMDLRMPVMDGYEAAERIRKMYPDAKIPIIALSASVLDEDRAKSAAAGMDAHVGKPVDARELFSCLASFL